MQQIDFESILMNNQNDFLFSVDTDPSADRSSSPTILESEKITFPDSLFTHLLNKPEHNSSVPQSVLCNHPRPESGDKPKRKRKASQVNIEKLLNPLKKDQLESVILGLIQQQPEMEDRIRTLLPTFDVATAIQEAQKLKQKVFQAFPNTRYGSSYDHYSFGRVKPIQSTYVTAVRKPISVMCSAKQWDELLDYLMAIIEESAELPDWDCENDQKQKKALFKNFATNLLKVLKQKESELSEVEHENIKTLCVTYNTGVHGSPFNDCLLFLARK